MAGRASRRSPEPHDLSGRRRRTHRIHPSGRSGRRRALDPLVRVRARRRRNRVRNLGHRPHRPSPRFLAIIWPYTSASRTWGSAWIGTAPLALAVIGVITGLRQKRAILWLAMTLAIMIVASLPSLWDGLLRYVPGANVEGTSTLVATAALGLAMLAGIGLDHLYGRLTTATAPRLKPLPIALCLVAFVELSAFAILNTSSIDAPRPIASTPSTRPATTQPLAANQSTPRAWITPTLPKPDRTQRPPQPPPQVDSPLGPAIRSIDDVPGRLRASVDRADGQYLVIATRYAPGWSAVLRFTADRALPPRTIAIASHRAPGARHPRSRLLAGRVPSDLRKRHRRRSHRQLRSAVLEIHRHVHRPWRRLPGPSPGWGMLQSSPAARSAEVQRV